MKILLAFCLLVIPVFAADEVIFEGLPSVRMDADGKESVRVDLSEQGSRKYACRIVARKKKFYWASRGDRELIRSDSGDYSYFISPEGTGFIKVALVKGGPFEYMEQLTTGLKTVTYWGKTAPAK
jgi:hypothetical protein